MTASPALAASAATVRWLLLLSAACLALQVALTDYGSKAERAAPALGWFFVGAALTWLVWRRRSGIARWFLVITALLGAVVYAIGALDSLRAGVLAVLYLGQALPLLSGPVRRHVQDR